MTVLAGSVTGVYWSQYNFVLYPVYGKGCTTEAKVKTGIIMQLGKNVNVFSSPWYLQSCCLLGCSGA